MGQSDAGRVGIFSRWAALIGADSRGLQRRKVLLEVSASSPKPESSTRTIPSPGVGTTSVDSQPQGWIRSLRGGFAASGVVLSSSLSTKQCRPS
eukprot:4619519-Pyramimonas_sp.AAC.2